MDQVKQEVRLPYNYACKFFNRAHINQRRSYPRVPQWTFKDGFALFDYQEEVVQIAEDHYQKKGSAFINVFCAFGKDCGWGIFLLEIRSESWTPKSNHSSRNYFRKIMVGTFRTHTHAKIHVVGLGPGPEIIPDDTQIIICADSRLKRIPPHVMSRVGHFVIDEADRFCTPHHVEGLLSVEPLAITILTATYERDDGMERNDRLDVG